MNNLTINNYFNNYLFDWKKNNKFYQLMINIIILI